jgi:CheY-like chemotaxis protein
VSRELERIRALAERAALLTQQLLAFGRRQSLHLVPVDLNALIEGFLVMLQRLAGEGVQISFAPDPDLPCTVADPAQLEQVVVNLTINARDAMGGGGRLTIRTGRAALGEGGGPAGLPPGEYVTLSVADTGVGMDEATRQHLFEPFFTTKEPGKGTGLGLASVYGIVTQHRGAIEVRSEPGRGAEFAILLPASPVGLPAAAQASAYAAERPPQPGSGETVLVVEDEVVVREVACSVLRRNGYEVLAARDGQQAEEVFAQRADDIDLLLTDLVMPGCSGRELHTRLTRRRPDLRVLYMSGYAGTAGDAYDVLDPGTEPLRKPFGPEELVRRVHEALSG